MTIFETLLSVTLVLTPLILLILLAAPLLDKRYAVSGRYALWLLVMLGLCLPFVPFLTWKPVTVEIPSPLSGTAAAEENAAYPPYFINRGESAGEETEIMSTYSGRAEARTAVKSFPAAETSGGAAAAYGDFTGAGIPAAVSSETSAVSSGNAAQSGSAQVLPYGTGVQVPSIIIMIWLAGVLISFAYYAVSHLLFLRFINRWRAVEATPGFLQVFETERARLGILRNIRLERCKGISAPMLAGFFSPSVLIPDIDYEYEDLPLIFRHELTHFKRRDLWYKLALMAVKCLHWFNPVVRLMVTQANKDIESICDALTVNGMNMEIRKKYSEVILSIASGPAVRSSQLTTCMNGGKNMLRQRFSNILGSEKKNGAALFILIGITLLTVGMMVGFKFSPARTGSAAESAGESITEVTDVYVEKAAAETTRAIEEAVDITELSVERAAAGANRVDGKDIAAADVTENAMQAAELGLEAAADARRAAEEAAQAAAEANRAAEDTNRAIADANRAAAESMNGILWISESNDAAPLPVRELYELPKSVTKLYENITDITVKASFQSVVINHVADRPNQTDEEAILSYYDWFDGHFTVTFENGHLQIIENGWQGMWEQTTDQDLSTGPRLFDNIRINLPNSFVLNSVNVDTANGWIDVNHPTVVGTGITLDTAGGDITLHDGGVTGDVTADTAGGNIYLLNNEIKGGVTADTVSGEIKILNSSISGEVVTDTASGGTEINGTKTGAGISADTVSGGVSVSDSSAGADINAVSVSGGVKLSNSGFAGLDVSTVTGWVEVNLPQDFGEYNLEFNASNNGHLTERRGTAESHYGGTSVVSRRSGSTIKIKTVNGFAEISDFENAER